MAGSDRMFEKFVATRTYISSTPAWYRWPDSSVCRVSKVAVDGGEQGAGRDWLGEVGIKACGQGSGHIVGHGLCRDGDARLRRRTRTNKPRMTFSGVHSSWLTRETNGAGSAVRWHAGRLARPCARSVRWQRQTRRPPRRRYQRVVKAPDGRRRWRVACQQLRVRGVGIDQPTLIVEVANA